MRITSLNPVLGFLNDQNWVLSAPLQFLLQLGRLVVVFGGLLLLPLKFDHFFLLHQEMLHLVSLGSILPQHTRSDSEP